MKKQPEKVRLDVLLKKNKIVDSRERARALILAGKVLVDQFPVDKVGTKVRSDATIVIKGEDNPFVSRGGLKLQEAFNKTDWSANGLVCMDVGASTGGFTDCLLQNNARHVYAIDVGYGQLAWKLRQDNRVTVLEKTNIRYLPPDAISDEIDLVTIDTAFISLKIVVPACMPFLKKQGRIMALIKPQFEVGRKEVGKGGVVRDPQLHERVIDELNDFFHKKGLQMPFVVPSPILGPKGNKEFLAGLQRF
ncbi:MAG: hemolysin [Candidatus Magnetoglobus multicellularis str. Araruama]|uniref:Hemolysin n=1 Tax=Candidatus Magnetoglobus multicellularis str. Araruama TaxID=890399 RepID=A0A1V1P934_9BACT|nr:MAG: hemolysin [Candidatus Magnetoglobus multicellularis str. Araruama]